MKRSFQDDPQLSRDLFVLLDRVFPGLEQAAEDARTLGAHWESVSTPFTLEQQGQVVAHVGVIELSLVLLGETARVGSVHAVATHPDFRRRGYYRRLMDEVLRYGENRFQTLILSTENPEYYEPFGFRVVPEHCFRVRCDSEGGSNGMRLLDLGRPDDLALLLRLLKTRQPVSTVVGVVDDTVVFCFNEGTRPLWYAEDLDVVVCLEYETEKLMLFDVVGPRVPPFGRTAGTTPPTRRRGDRVFRSGPAGRECSGHALCSGTRRPLDSDGAGAVRRRGKDVHAAADGTHLGFKGSAPTLSETLRAGPPSELPAILGPIISPGFALVCLTTALAPEAPLLSLRTRSSILFLHPAG